MEIINDGFRGIIMEMDSKQKLAVYLLMDCNMEIITPHDPGVDNENYLRITEYLDVEFTPIDDAELVNKQIAGIDKQIKDTQVAAQMKVNMLTAMKNDLLALPEL